MSDFDPVDRPKHYNSHPSGVEIYEITRHLNFSLGNAFKYIARFDKKGNPVEDLRKSIWYIKNGIADRKSFSRFAVVCGDWEVLDLLLSRYIAAEPSMRVKGLLTLFRLAIEASCIGGNGFTDTLQYLISGMEVFIESLQVPQH